MNIKYLFWAVLVFTSLNSSYEFYGKHFMASYKECDLKALTNLEELKNAFEEAVRSSKATILKKEYVEFSGNGLTATLVLSESHASIHTYPEHEACFVDLFTCGHTCSWEDFDAVLQKYLQPKDPVIEVKIRS